MIRDLLQMEERKQLRVINLLWHWWLETNRVREGEKRRDSAQLGFLIARTADEFLAIGKEATVAGPKQRKQWKKPMQGTYKINCEHIRHQRADGDM
ncbi:hypothetical protein GQ55_2G422800 [Panicum hallii var. hallii]|uniref:Uncharacterized protein n=1 Tax=Panicum hallii var. hallii TaxID=1504633 RepID=A0A2T7EY79_9POAL|nr:hypothetical protein GQ55_2G422800 [Panicum hallii var. hallii]